MTDTTRPSSQFDLDTAVSPPADGHATGTWSGAFSNRWDIGDKPNGGYMLAVAVRAMTGHVAETHPHPFSVNAHYLRPGEPGPVAIDVGLVRTGRTLATVTGALSQNGKEKLHLVGSFGDLAKASGPSVIAGIAPDLPPPQECVAQDGNTQIHYAPSRIASSIEVRLSPNVGWARDEPSGIAEVTGWLRFADGREPDVLSLALFADAMPPAVFEVLPAKQWVPTIELTVHFRAIPAPGWLKARFTTRYLVSGFFEEDGELWDSTGQLVAQSRQLAMILSPEL